MAIGDDALAAGMTLVNGNAANSAPTIDDYINETRDFIAQRTNAITPVAQGGTGAASAAAARANLAVPETAVPGLKFTTPGFGRISFQAPGVAFESEIALASSLAAKADASALAGKARRSVEDGYLNPVIYGRGTSGQWRSLAVQADGTLAQTASAARFKTNAEALDVTDEQLAALQLTEFDWIADGTHDVGVIADEVEKVLPWAVFHDENDIILGVHYDRLGLALLPVVQRLLARVADLEQQVAK